MAQSLIAAAGFSWDAEKVQWGARGKKGRLLGFLPNAKRAGPIDFSDQIGVYALCAEYRRNVRRLD